MLDVLVGRFSGTRELGRTPICPVRGRRRDRAPVANGHSGAETYGAQTRADAKLNRATNGCNGTI
jgi:hypothetical protein